MRPDSWAYKSLRKSKTSAREDRGAGYVGGGFRNTVVLRLVWARRAVGNAAWLRGGPLDVFGCSQERKPERALAAGCLAMVRAISDQGASIDKEAATQDLKLVQEVKGFGHVKQRNWQHVEPRWQEAGQRWSV